MPFSEAVRTVALVANVDAGGERSAVLFLESYTF
jgi:hypothetical protein